MTRRLAALLCAAAIVCAGEADPRAQARALWSEAAQANDLWTCLQLEEWGREQKPALRLNACLGSSVVLGSTLLAFPEGICQAADYGDHLLVASDRRLYTLAPDGRPLRRSLPFHLVAPFQCFGYAGQAVASVASERDRKSGAQILSVATTAVESGRLVFQTRWTLSGTQRWNEEVQVADDGSAVALTIRDPDREERRSQAVTLCLADRQTPVPGLHSPSAVGPKGAWLVGISAGKQTLVRGERRQAISAAAGGPGILAAVGDGKPFLVLADGSDHPLETGQPLGSDPAMASVGAWLVLQTGSGAKAISKGDLLGDGAGVEAELPSALLLWRWADLAKDPAAAPATAIPGHLSQASNLPAALIVWDGKAVDLIDLSGREAQRSRYFDASFPVGWAWFDQGDLVLHREDGTRALYGPDKSELWSGKADDSWLKRRDLLLTATNGKGDGRHYQLHRLAADPGRRTTVALDLDPVEQAVDVGFRLRDWVVGYHHGEWRRLGLDGKLIDRGSRDGADARPRPEPDLLWSLAGRFCIEDSRLYTKAGGRPAEPTRHLSLQDAWRFGNVTMLLESDRTVLAATRRRSEPVELGRRSEADRFGLASKQAALLGEDGHAVALIGAGPSLIAKPGEGRIDEMPAGPWRLEDAGFTVPHGRQQAWDGERVGFSPVRLRSPDDGSLFVITRPVLIELDPEAARAVGKDR